MPQCINSTSPGCRNWVDQRPGPCSRRVFDFVNNRLFWLVWSFWNIIRESPIGPVFWKKNRVWRQPVLAPVILLKTSKNWQSFHERTGIKEPAVIWAQMFDVFLNRGHIRAGFWNFLRTTLVGSMNIKNHPNNRCGSVLGFDNH